LSKSKDAQVGKHGKTWHDRGPTWHNARRLYLKYPLLAAADLARILEVSRQTIDQYVDGLKEEREKRREDALVKLKAKEGL
jgi:HTH domain